MPITDFTEKKLNLSRGGLVVICVVFGLVVLAWILDSILDPMIKSTDLNIMATIVSKDMDPTLYPRDALFSNDELFRLYTPVYRWILAQVWQMAGTFEMGLVLLVPLVLSVYLIGMFILLWRVTQNSWVALALTVFSAHYHPVTMGAGVWGVGGSAEMMSRTLFMPMIPFIFLFFLYVLNRPIWYKAAMLGLTIGLAANFHPVSGFHLLALLSVMLILIHGNTFTGWQSLVSMVSTAVLGALPVSLNYLKNSGQPVDSEVTFASFSRIVAERYSMPFFPNVFKWQYFNLELTRPVLDVWVWFYFIVVLLFLVSYLWGQYRWPGLRKWGWLVGGLITLTYAYPIALFNTTFVFGIVILYIIYRFWRGQYSWLDTQLMIFLGLIVLYTFVGYYFLTFFWQVFEVWALTSLLIEYARAARFIYLPVYLLAGLALAAWSKDFGNTPLRRKMQNIAILVKAKIPFAWEMVLIITLVLVLFGPLSGIATYISLPARNLLSPDNWVVGLASSPADAELYEWVQQNTVRDSLFYGCFGPETMTYFRRKTERSISHNWKDLTFSAHNRAALVYAYNRFHDLESACKNFNSAIVVAHTIQADYILVSKQDAASYLHEACFVNEKYAVFTLDPNGCK